jgi:hypothetical protein
MILTCIFLKCIILKMFQIKVIGPNGIYYFSYFVGWGETKCPLHQLQIIDENGALMQLELEGETKLLGENLPQCHSVNHRINMT